MWMQQVVRWKKRGNDPICSEKHKFYPVRKRGLPLGQAMLRKALCPYMASYGVLPVPEWKRVFFFHWTKRSPCAHCISYCCPISNTRECSDIPVGSFHWTLRLRIALFAMSSKYSGLSVSRLWPALNKIQFSCFPLWMNIQKQHFYRNFTS